MIMMSVVVSMVIPSRYFAEPVSGSDSFVDRRFASFTASSTWPRVRHFRLSLFVPGQVAHSLLDLA